MTFPNGDVQTWSVDEASQQVFVETSGDCNPLHVDPVAARRLPFGRVAVHGVHLLLDALERFCTSNHQSPTGLSVTFRHSVGIGDRIETTIGEIHEGTVTIHVGVDVWTAADISLTLTDSLDAPDAAAATTPLADDPALATSTATGPEVHSMTSLDGATGAIPVPGLAREATDRFPTLTDRLGSRNVAELLSLTRLVGMHVPGLHSLFSAIKITLRPGTDGDGRSLSYRVVRADDRFSRVVIEVDGASVSGTLTAFLRPEPVDQELGVVVPEPGEFAGSRVVVVGGSRGLGATAVQLLAAGGADVRFTYLHGADDAARIERDGASAYRLDVHRPDDGLAAILANHWSPTHLAYFASPPIFDGAAGVYSDALFERFRTMYVDDFVNLVEMIGPDAMSGVLWPSSTALDEVVPGMAEYSDAKRVGETVCAQLLEQYPQLVVASPRFPRLLTDQSTSFVPVEFGDTGTEVLAALREMYGAGREDG